jgi:hypothetical protein
MPTSRDGNPCDVEIFKRWRGPVIADGGEENQPLPQPIGAILEEFGFVEKAHPPAYRWYELPPTLDAREERGRATGATIALTRAGYRVELDPALVVRLW